jgi:hypothetical protein
MPKDEGKIWIEFKMVGQSESGKTYVWEVMTNDGRHRLGKVSWFGRWRKYAFNPEDNTCWFEEDCLRTIASFCEDKTHEHRIKNSNVS